MKKIVGAAFLSTMMLLAIGMISPSASQDAERQQRLDQPFPHPQTRHYIPGPFIVRLNEDMAVKQDQYGVIANAIDSWSERPSPAFLICFRSPPDGKWKDGAFEALRAASYELKARGAAVVVWPNGSTCSSSYAFSEGDGSHVEIMGVFSSD